MFRVKGSVAVLAVVAAALLGADRGARVVRGVAYGDDPAQTLDLYLPAPAVEAAPLLVFVHSRSWSAAPGGEVVAGGFAEPLQAEGAAVAIVRHRVGAEHRHPGPARDVAAALAHLLDDAGRHGFDPRRVFLAGHGSGAHLAALVALDPRYLKREDLSPADLAGVVALSGVYDLEPDPATPEELGWYERAFGDVEGRRSASPVRHLGADAPRFLLLSAEKDIGGYVRGADAFAAALRDGGQPDAESYVMMGRDHASVLDLKLERTGTLMYLLDFIGLEPLPPALIEAREISRHWRKPRFSTEPFWTSGAPVQSHEADARFAATAHAIFQVLRYQRATFLPRRFHAIDLFDLLAALGTERVGTGGWLTLTNVLNEKAVLSLADLRPLRPVVVIGVDGERNLFRRFDVYRAKKEYSWRDDLPPPPFVVRPMGAFLYFLEDSNRSPLPATYAHFSLETGSFSLSEEDPLARLRDLDREVFWTLHLGRACVSCHSFRGVGSRAGNLRAVDAEPQGGYALPLEEYPHLVWRRFVFEPAEVAALIDAPHPAVWGRAAVLLFEAVERERNAKSPRGAPAPTGAAPGADSTGAVSTP